MPALMHSTVSDLLAGYVTQFHWDRDSFGLKTSDGREFEVAITPTTSAQMIRNLGEPYADATMQMRDMLVPDRYVYAYGVFYPEGERDQFEAKGITFLGRMDEDYPFEKPDWWIKQVGQIGDFFLRAEFPDGNYDFRNYRTQLSLTGTQVGTVRQETDTISRLVYGFASAYLMTGEDRFLEAAEAGTNYLRDHMRVVDRAEGTAYWFHAIDISGASERKIFASEFGDDLDAIPAYEQIYALAGPTQTYRVTGDPRILDDIRSTIELFDKYFFDKELGGYFSHIDPVTFDPRSDALGHNRARKNWNSVGDHAPAYLINAYLATGDQKFADMLSYVADIIEARFPDYDNSPFVQERFHEDWSHDQTWGWQQNRAVVGHNLKIAWNLMRIYHLRPDERFLNLAKKIVEIMPAAGSDLQRGGWYDVVERERRQGQKYHRFAWHDRKAWWQQEQAILAYLIIAGSLQDQEALRLARESASFYNAWFLDQDSGGVYFNVLANGVPYLTGTERFKGSHSMSGYHSFELAYLAAVYTNLLITKEPMDFYFKPQAGGFPDNVLRVQPDILPPGSVRLEAVWINNEPYADFDADALTVKLPDGGQRVNVRVRIAPTVDTYEASTDVQDGVAKITVAGKVDGPTVLQFQKEIEAALDRQPAPTKVVLLLHDLEYLSNAGIRALLLTRQQLGLADTSDIVAVAPNESVKEALQRADPYSEDFTIVDEYDG